MAGGVTHGQQALGQVGARVRQVLSGRGLGRYFLEAGTFWNLGKVMFPCGARLPGGVVNHLLHHNPVADTAVLVETAADCPWTKRVLTVG